jgi:hypothetical protein
MSIRRNRVKAGNVDVVGWCNHLENHNPFKHFIGESSVPSGIYMGYTMFLLIGIRQFTTIYGQANPLY